MNSKQSAQELFYKRIAVVVLTLVVVAASLLVLGSAFSKNDVRVYTQPVVEWAETEYGVVLPASNVSDERTFEADSAIDGNPESCWCVNTDQDGGAGAQIMIGLEQECIVSGVKLINGNVYLPEEDLFKRNGQVKNFTLTFSDGSQKSFTAAYNDSAATEYEYFHFDEPVLTEYISLTVDDGYAGEKFPQNVCITEIAVYRGNPSELQEEATQAEPTSVLQEEVTEVTEAVTEQEDTTQTELVNDHPEIKKWGIVSYETPAGAGVNVRKSPSSLSTLLTTLAEGTLLLYYPDTVTGDYVYCLFTESDEVTEGWIMTKYVVAQDDSLNVYGAYSRFLEEAQNTLTLGDALAAVDDINDDDVPELLVSGWDDCVIVFAYDFAEGEVYELVRKPMGKGYDMTAMYSKSLHRVVFPSASTGGEVYEILEFTADTTEQYLLLEYENGKFTENGEAVYMKDGKSITKGSYSVQLAVIRNTYKKIDTSIEDMIAELEERIKE